MRGAISTRLASSSDAESCRRCPTRGRPCPREPRRAASRSRRRASRWTPTTTRSPWPMPRRSASTGDSSARWCARRNFSAGESSTSGAAQIERNVPRRSAPLGDRRVRRRLEPERPEVGLGPGRGLRARRPAHAAPADLVERQPVVEADRVEQRRRGHRAGQHAGVVVEALAEVGEHRPLAAHRVGPRDRRAQPLHAPVGVRDRALLLGVGLGREDDVGVLPEPLGEERGVRDDGLRARQRLLPQAPVGQVAQRVDVQQVERLELVGRRGGGDRARCRGRARLTASGRGRRSAARRPRAARGRCCRPAARAARSRRGRR